MVHHDPAAGQCKAFPVKVKVGVPLSAMLGAAVSRFLVAPGTARGTSQSRLVPFVTKGGRGAGMEVQASMFGRDGPSKFDQTHSRMIHRIG